MNIIVLDDNRERLDAFAQWFNGHVTTCTTAAGCIALLDVARLMGRLGKPGINALYIGAYGDEVATWLTALPAKAPIAVIVVTYYAEEPTVRWGQLESAGYRVTFEAFTDLQERYNAIRQDVD